MIANQIFQPFHSRRLVAHLGVFCLLVYASSPTAVADDSASSFSGFGTFGASYLNRDDRDFTQNRTMQGEGAGATDRISYKVDTVLAAQWDYQWRPEMTSSVQAAVLQDYQGDMSPALTLAMLRWNVAPDWRLRVGRMHNPQFLFSDSWLVRFGQTAARARSEVYFMFPIWGFDGATVDYSFDIGGARGNLMAGWSVLDNVTWRNGKNAELRGPIVNATLSEDAWTLKFSYSDFTISTSPTVFDGQFQLLENLDPNLIGRLRIIDGDWRVWAFGVEYDDGRWHSLFEWALRETSPALTSQTRVVGTYLTQEYRFERFSLYGSLFYLDTHVDYQAYQDSVALSLIIPGQSTGDLGQRGFAFGASLPLNDSWMMRLQWDRFFIEEGSFGLFLGYTAQYQLSDPAPVSLVSVNVDFLF